MKQVFFSLSIILVFGLSAFAQTTQKDAMKTGATEQKLMQLEKAMLDSILQGKFADLEKYYADGYVFTAPDAMQITRTDLLSAFKSGALKVESSTNSDMKVTLFGDTAIVRYKSMDKGTLNGQSISGTYQWTDVFVKIKGNWRLVSTHGTPVGQ